MAHELPKLNYDYTALEPHIDAKTMEIHHTKHHQGYVNKLNAAIEGTDLADKSLVELMKTVSKHGAGVRNNGGGHYNHSLFWSILTPGGSTPNEGMMNLINNNFGSFDKMKEEFASAAGTRFGSGWAWLCKMADGKLCICSTPNQDNPLMDVEGCCGGTPILGLDVWEHAYYLNYQNRRPDYVSAFWNIVNWDQVAENYNNA